MEPSYLLTQRTARWLFSLPPNMVNVGLQQHATLGFHMFYFVHEFKLHCFFLRNPIITFVAYKAKNKIIEHLLVSLLFLL